MNNIFCPNYKGCQIIYVEGFVKSIEKRAFYIKEFCKASEKCWSACKRYQTKKILNICPDFILPDSVFTIDEILDKIEQ